MLRKVWVTAALLSVALAAPIAAKNPAPADEKAVREIIIKVYEGYSRPIAEPSADGEEAVSDGSDIYEPPYTATLAVQIARWSKLMADNEELYSLNSFDWYCQCQDFDNNTAKVVRQNYKLVGTDRIDANILFSPGWVEQGVAGDPLLFRFKREGGTWKLDDLRFDGGSTLRKDLAGDIKDATRDQAKTAG